MIFRFILEDKKMSIKLLLHMQSHIKKGIFDNITEYVFTTVTGFLKLEKNMQVKKKNTS